MSRSMTTPARFSGTNQFSNTDDRGLKPFSTPCPTWCRVATGESEYPFHRDYEPFDGQPQLRVHEGPAFDDVEIEGVEYLGDGGRVSLSAIIVQRGSAASVADLRETAADILAAAEWIEANQ